MIATIKGTLSSIPAALTAEYDLFNLGFSIQSRSSSIKHIQNKPLKKDLVKAKSLSQETSWTWRKEA